jgi:hypothetical protein
MRRLSPTPAVWLGAPSPGGLALPDAQPTPSQVYAPRGVWLTERGLIAADSGNHRLLIWHERPTQDGQAADVVLGQPDFTREGPAAGGRGPANGLYLPTGVAVYEGRLYVADSWHHRVLVWETLPEASDQPPDYALGQPDLSSVQENQGGPPCADTLYWPYGLGYVNGWFYITDTGNRRVLGWRGFPEPGQPADLVLGQDTPGDALENRGDAVSARNFRWPHAVAGDETSLYVADAGNHRVLGWSPAPEADRPADLVLGQPGFETAQEFAYVKQGAGRLRFPYAISLEDDLMAVADTANNRVLLWQNPPRSGCGHPADSVIGQANMDANGENEWKAVTHHTLCWPYGLHLRAGWLAIADSGNNRVMLWRVESQ